MVGALCLEQKAPFRSRCCKVGHEGHGRQGQPPALLRRSLGYQSAAPTRVQGKSSGVVGLGGPGPVGLGGATPRRGRRHFPILLPPHVSMMPYTTIREAKGCKPNPRPLAAVHPATGVHRQRGGTSPPCTLRLHTRRARVRPGGLEPALGHGAGRTTAMLAATQGHYVPSWNFKFCLSLTCGAASLT